MAGDRIAELMALLQGGKGGLGVEGMYGPTMGAMQGGANIQRGRFGMPRTSVEPIGGRSLPEEGEALTDEDMLSQVQRGMGAGEPPPGSGMKWENLEDDQAALENAPTDQNISAFVDYWGEDKLPEAMKNPNENAPDYARPGD